MSYDDGCPLQSGWLNCSANDDNMTLKLTVMRSAGLGLASTECSSHDGKISSVPLRTRTTT